MSDFVLVPAWLREEGAKKLFTDLVCYAVAAAPFTNYPTKYGAPIRAKMTGLGLGWISTQRGYGYDTVQPLTGKAFAPLPAFAVDLAHTFLAETGCPERPRYDALLINQYEPGCTMAPHRDADEECDAAIVCFSLGGPATFQFDGTPYVLGNGDAYAFWGNKRNALHGITATGGKRYALTFRQVKK